MSPSSIFRMTVAALAMLLLTQAPAAYAGDDDFTISKGWSEICSQVEKMRPVDVPATPAVLIAPDRVARTNCQFFRQFSERESHEPQLAVNHHTAQRRY